MTSFINFLTEYYIIFDVITIFLIFSLIGYFVNLKKEKKSDFKLDESNMNNNHVNTSNNFQMNMSNESTVKTGINQNVSLQDYVNKTANIKNNENNNM